MCNKIIAVAFLVSLAEAGLIPAGYLSHPSPAIAKVTSSYGYAPIAKYAAPIAKTVVAEEYDPHPQYNFAYEINDGLTGDSKNQHEVRDGDVVQGSYSLIDSDGFKRTVEYTADPHNGFNAIVHREPIAHKTVVSAPVAKIPQLPHYYH